MLSKLVVTNYRVFGSLTLELNEGLNILVGDNDAGKTTVMEAIHLALTNRLDGQWFNTQLSPFHFNQATADAYIAGVQAGQNFPPPEIVIDLYLTPIDEIASLKGKNNSTLEDVPGLRVRAYFDQNYAEEYGKFVQDKDAVTLVPIEYYRVDWLDFAGNQPRFASKLVEWFVRRRASPFR